MSDNQPASPHDVGGFSPRRDRIAVTVTEESSTVVVAVVGSVDGLTAATFTGHLRAALDRQPSTLIVDFTGVRFLSSVGLEALVREQRAGATTHVVMVAGCGGF